MNSRVIAIATATLVGAGALLAAPSQSAESSLYVVAVGDIASTVNGPQVGVASLTKALNPNAVLLLGDLAYKKGSNSDFNTKFLPSWGSVLSNYPTYAIPGNHEFKTKNASGYRKVVSAYKLPKTGNDLWWSKNLGDYTIIGLDSEGLGTGAKLNAKGKREKKFLTKALVAANGRPTIVTWHRPRYSSGPHGNQSDIGVATLWNLVSVDADVKLVLWGHDHDFETNEISVAGRNLMTMVVGTGGAEAYDCTGATCIDHIFGALVMTLSAKKIDWEFRSTETSDKGTVLKSGTISW